MLFLNRISIIFSKITDKKIEHILIINNLNILRP